MNEIPRTSGRRSWHSDNAATRDPMIALQDRLSVALIATPRKVLHTCRSDETLAEVMARNREGFDYFPVIDSTPHQREQIIGLVELIPFLRGKEPKGIVHEMMHRLCEDNLIGANAGILTFVKAADRNSCRLVMSGGEISGLVTLSDLQQLPVRAALFALITHVEMTMADAIRREFDGSNGWLDLLSQRRKDEIEKWRRAAAAVDNLVDDLLLTGFGDKKNIILKSPGFPGAWKTFDSDMNEAKGLRNSLAHANHYAATREAAAKVCDTVRRIEHWIAQLSEWPSKQAPGGD
jgi:CBS domain-containing protein